MLSAASLLLRRILVASCSLTTMFVIAGTTACGSGGSSSGGGPTFSGNTSVHVLISSAANDQLSRFDIQLQSLKLTDQSGTVIELLPADQGLEFIHVNGGIEPLLTASVPQGIYASATAAIGTAEFSCVTLQPSGGLVIHTFAYGQMPAENVTVDVPSPITVTGSNMSVVVNMQVSKSVAFSNCYDPNGQYTYSITPTFELTPVSLSLQPTNSKNGKVTALDGKVASVDLAGNSFQLSLPPDLYIEPNVVSIKSNNGTTYDGISGLSGLSPGTLIDMDGAIQADGSVSATRIAVLDATTTNLSMQTGPIIQTNSSVPLFAAFEQRQQGYFYDTKQAAIWIPYDHSSALFQIAGNSTNRLSLPFVATFNALNMVPGQNVYVTSHAAQVTGNPYTPAATITLFPQTINGTIAASSTSGGFAVYTVNLSPLSLFPQLAVQPGQSTLLSNPSQVDVYVDSNTQKVNITSLAPGSTLRFYGLVFNDNGALRMDCAQVSDGVASAPPSNAVIRLQAGHGQATLRQKNGSMPQVITTVTRSY